MKTRFLTTFLFIFLFHIFSASQAFAKAKAGPDQTVNEGDTVILDGSESKLKGGIDTYQWQQTGGSPTVNLVNADKAKASFTAPDFDGAVTLLTFKLTVSNNSEKSDTDTTTVTVRPANQPPTASFTFTTSDLTVNLNASGSSDTDGIIASYAWDFGDGNSGSGKTTSHKYAAAGTYSVELTVTDNDGDTDTDSHTVTVSAPNQPPVTDNDSYSTDEDTPLTVAKPGVLVNDTDPEGDSLKAIKASNPSNGTLNFLKSDGSFRYTPNAGFNGTDSFTYKANDGTSDSNVATVTISVKPVNDPPVANNDSYSTDEDTPLTLAKPGVLANDTDPDGDPLTAILQTGPSDGMLTLNPDGSFTYTPNLNFFGTDSFTYRANDGNSNSNLATVTTTVNTVNDPPKANNDSYSTNEDTTLNVSAPGVLANDSDPDGNPLTAILRSSPSNGSLTLDNNGSFTYRPDADFNGTDSFTYVANDGTSDSNVARVTITVNPAVDPPIADAGPDQTVGENTTVTLGGSNSFDTEGEKLFYQWDQLAGPPVTLSDPKAANPTFTAPSSVGPGGESLTFQLTVTDEEAAQATDTTIANVTVPLANGPPNADAGVDQTVDEDSTVTLDGSNSFDPDGDNLSYQWIQVTGPSVTLSDPTADKPTFETPFVESAGLSFTFELTVTDTSGLQATDTTIVNVTLPFANEPPAAVVGDDQTVDEDTEVTLDGFGSSDPEGENLFYRWRQVAGRPVTLSDPVAEQPTFLAPNVESGGVSLLFELTVTDVGRLQAVVDTLVNVTGDNDFPIADAGNNQAVDENSTITLDGSGSVDPEGENLSYVWRQVAGPSVTLSNPTAEQTTFTAPNVTPSGVSLTFELTVIDVIDLQSRNNTEISVFGNNDLPTADAGPDQMVLEKSTVPLDASNSSDPDVDDIITYQWNQTGGTAVTLSDPTDKRPTFEAPSFDDANGQPLIFELIVTDRQGEQSQEDSTTVTVSNFEKDNPGTSGGGCFIATAADG
ncbi:MAG: tandem-95 repeat protein [Syntrophobacterales bacterium]